MIGFGRQPYTTADGKEHEWFAVGLAPRKAALTFYGLLTPADGSRTTTCSSASAPTPPARAASTSSASTPSTRAVLTELVERAWQENHQPG